MTDYKEYAKQMRENAAKDSNGNVVSSPELWEQIASIIEQAIIPPCKVGNCIYYPWHYDDNSGVAILEVDKIVIKGETLVFILDPESDMPMPCWFSMDDFGKTVFISKEKAEEKLRELKDNA